MEYIFFDESRIFSHSQISYLVCFFSNCALNVKYTKPKQTEVTEADLLTSKVCNVFRHFLGPVIPQLTALEVFLNLGKLPNDLAGFQNIIKSF